VPANIVCSWSLNPQTVIDNEEHFTAALDERLASARTVADRGIKVAFHFHPMVCYNGWENDYAGIAGSLIEQFEPEEVLFISFGSVTLIKPVVQKIRELGNPTKILQMRLVPDPHGKLTYPDEIKIRMFRLMHRTFRPWHKKVFFYLCMEKRSIWESSLGYAWPTNERFEQEFGKQTMRKIRNSD
jgi:spore photoproduct lyase